MLLIRPSQTHEKAALFASSSLVSALFSTRRARQLLNDKHEDKQFEPNSGDEFSATLLFRRAYFQEEPHI